MQRCDPYTSHTVLLNIIRWRRISLFVSSATLMERDGFPGKWSTRRGRDKGSGKCFGSWSNGISFNSKQSIFSFRIRSVFCRAISGKNHRPSNPKRKIPRQIHFTTVLSFAYCRMSESRFAPNCPHAAMTVLPLVRRRRTMTPLAIRASVNWRMQSSSGL